MQARSMALNVQVKKRECLQWIIALYNVICGISPHLTVPVSPGGTPTLPQTCSACLRQHKLAVESGAQGAMHVFCIVWDHFSFSSVSVLIPESKACTTEPETVLISACHVMFVIFAFGGPLSCFWAFQ